MAAPRSIIQISCFSIFVTTPYTQTPTPYFLYLPMMAASLCAVASGQWFGAVKIAFFNAELHLHSRGAVLSDLTAFFIIIWALRTFLFRYSMTVSTVTASCAGCQQS